MIWLYLLLTTHITMSFFTIYVHRGLTHKGLTFHPILSHIIRFWLWFMDGSGIKEWVAIHRNHHRFSDTKNDPHSFFVIGTKTEKILFTVKIFYQSVVYGYKNFATKEEIERFGKGTPDDWIERNLYFKHQRLGILFLLGLNLWLFGWSGILVWLIQISWVTLCATVIITVLAHHFGYRDGDSKDKSRNLFPIGIILAGEELHNNHHMDPSNPKFSKRWFEFDLGWIYIKIFSFLGLTGS